MSPSSTRNRTSSSTRGARGFSLLEVLFAMTLFALVGTAVNVLAIQSMRQTLHNRHGTTAVMLAQSQVENLEAARYDDIAAAHTTAAVDGLAYTIDTHVDVDTPGDGMKQVTITVSWTSLEGSDSYVVETVFTSSAS
jgi:prepilin-type N-terminal cleavage/methylation domain-containing protein